MGAHVTTLKGRSTQVGPEAGIEVGVRHAVARRTRHVTDLIKGSPPGGLPRSAEGIEVEEGRVAQQAFIFQTKGGAGVSIRQQAVDSAARKDSRPL